ncbi:MAG TPA: PAS domain-containing sensor histidine kinase [Draconibacterium sp.]|nr:PAS domain-containing sensor histidine kinase [Draconibacterium sp.]
MTKSWYHIISERLWPNIPTNNKIRLLKLLAVLLVLFFIAISNLIIHLVASEGTNCFVCDLGIIITIVLAGVCLLNGKLDCVLYLTFAIPLFIYAYYISDFSEHLPLIETVYNSIWWLFAGLLFLFLVAESESITFIYFLLSLFTLGFQLLKANRLFDSFSYYEPFTTHPIFVFSALYAAMYFIRNRYKSMHEHTSQQLIATRQSITKVIQDSVFSVAQIRAERDEDGNVVNLWIDKVNNAFEASFKINLHEVQNQEAGYIFNLLFRHNFDVNKTVLFDQKKTREFQAKKLEKWFKVHVLKPEYNKFYLIFEDITAMKKKIAELESNKKRYKVLLEAIPDIFFIIDKDGTYEDFVIKESDLLKIEDTNIIGSNIYSVGFPDNMADKIYSCIQSSLKNNSIETIEYSLNTQNGTFLFEMRLAKLNAHSVISIARDITKRKTAEFNLEKALIKAEESDRLKSAFLANLSHEIRTPLNIITNFTRMLAEPEVEYEERMELSDAITQNGQQLLNMIDNTIHLSKIETESVEVNMDFCKINSVVRDIYNRYLPIIPDTKDIRLKMNLDVPNPVFGFITDQRLLKETLIILVDNAIKYTQKGEVTVGYEMIKNEEVRFIVSDTGIGIPEDEIENIFSRFYRVRNLINDSTSGSGLGLPIALHYVKLLGGELNLETKSGHGTKFTFILPFKEGKGFLKIVS